MPSFRAFQERLALAATGASDRGEHRSTQGSPGEADRDLPLRAAPAVTPLGLFAGARTAPHRITIASKVQYLV